MHTTAGNICKSIVTLFERMQQPNASWIMKPCFCAAHKANAMGLLDHNFGKHCNMLYYHSCNAHIVQCDMALDFGCMRHCKHSCTALCSVSPASRIHSRMLLADKARQEVRCKALRISRGKQWHTCISECTAYMCSTEGSQKSDTS